MFVRAALCGRRVVRYLDVTVGSPSEPPGWKAETWGYEGFTFIAAPTSSRALASALDPYDAQVLLLGGLALTLPVLSGQMSWQHSRAAPASTRWRSRGRRLSASCTFPAVREDSRARIGS